MKGIRQGMIILFSVCLLAGMSTTAFSGSGANKPKLTAGEAELGIDFIKGVPKRICSDESFRVTVQITNHGIKTARFRILTGHPTQKNMGYGMYGKRTDTFKVWAKVGKKNSQNRHTTTIMLANSWDSERCKITTNEDTTSFCDKNKANNQLPVSIAHGATGKKEVYVPQRVLIDNVCPEDKGSKEGPNKVDDVRSTVRKLEKLK